VALCGAPLRTAWADTGAVWVALSDRGGAYADASQQLRNELDQTDKSRWSGNLVTALWRELPALADRPPQLVVTLGVAAYRGVSDWSKPGGPLSKVPVLAGLLPRSAFEPVPGRPPQLTGAVLLDQPVERYLALLAQAMPGRRRVGVLWGPTSLPQRPALLKAATAMGMRLVEGQVPDNAEPADVYPVLLKVLSDADVLLGLPDPVVFNAQSLQNLLIAAYRQRVPLLTYSAAHVAAGATLALHVTPGQVGARLGVVARGFLGGGGLPPLGGAPDFAVAVNAQVGRSLGLSLDSPEALVAALRRSEGGK